MAAEQSTTNNTAVTTGHRSGKVTNPKDGRLKANRDFQAFKMRAIVVPGMQGTFRSDPERINAAEDRNLRTQALAELTDSQLLQALRNVLAAEGYEPKGRADTVLDVLSARIKQRQRGH